MTTSSAEKPAPDCPVLAYCSAVLSGKIVAGRLVRLACERHLRDLEHGPARGLKWDAAAASRAIRFFSFLRLPADGEIDGKPFELEPFQAFIIGSIYGWKLASDNFRRFRTAYIEQGKGNGKTPLAAGVGLYGLVADGEAGAEIYPAATTREQAGILFRDAKRMAESSPKLREKLQIGLHNIAYPATDSYLRPVSSEHRGLDGKRPHYCLIDEIHEHPSAMVIDKMRAGTKSRRQALVFEITNSGHDRETVCWQHHQYSASLLEGHIENDSWFAYVCQLDPCEGCRAEGKIQPTEGCPKCDDWKDEKVWEKVNPGIDRILPRKYLREQVQEAAGMPAKEGIVKRLNFCIWTEGMTRAIPMDSWDSCETKLDMDALTHLDCFGGLDIGATSDFTAFVLLFAHDDAETVEIAGEDGPREVVRRSYSLLPYFWLPEKPVRRDERMTGIIDAWRRAGHVRTTPGEVVDYDVVLQDIVKLADEYPIQMVAFDRGFQGASIGTKLIDQFGAPAIRTFPQGIISMNGPFREFIEMIRLGRIKHNGHPVMRWMAANCVAEERGGLIKPSKEASDEKIDGIAAAVMALGVAMTTLPSQAAFEAW